MKKLSVILLSSLVFSGETFATETMVCASRKGEVSASLLMGSLDVVAIASASVTFGDKSWATEAAGDKKIVVGQAFEDGSHLNVDFTDEQIITKIAELRLVKASEEDNFAVAGTLRLPGLGAWAVDCTE